eukprot:TRINITY_DN48634_c0_g1_i1.p1 TRINITY_DN48634_c0_g1~~TRINITY_DN48634_c0_g1_i1.p1  ORF type:complete len:435 (+),score=71.38 TRINITY_DN48634_c0_g1_i1:94-1398(+)
MAASVVIFVMVPVLVFCERFPEDGFDDESWTHDFDAYTKAFDRAYQTDSGEYRHRRDLFHKRVAEIVALNSRKGRLWTAGVNHLTDRTPQELDSLLGLRLPSTQRNSGAGGASLLDMQEVRSLPDSVDWRSLRMSTDVPDQKECGSCWAVTAISVLQARKEIAHNMSVRFSAQQLVNCVDNPQECGGQGGCKGATVELALEYTLKNGLDIEPETPYYGKDGICTQQLKRDASRGSRRRRSERRLAALGLASFETLPSNTARPLLEAVIDGPVAISVAGSTWTTYQQGIFNDCPMNPVIDHAVTLFGYGEEDGENYWLIRNSWGRAWGESGFIRVTRKPTIKQEDADCGWDHDPKEGISCKPYPLKIRVCGHCGLLTDSVTVSFRNQSAFLEREERYITKHRKAFPERVRRFSRFSQAHVRRQPKWMRFRHEREH